MDEPKINRCEITIHFRNPRDLDFKIPLNILDREVAFIDVDGERYIRASKREHDYAAWND